MSLRYLLNFTTLALFLCIRLNAQIQFAEDFEEGVSLEGVELNLDFEIIKIPLKDYKGWLLNVYEDSKGYIWLRPGIFGSLRYDGQEFSFFSHKVSDTYSNNRVVVHDILEGHNGSHWICSSDNMVYYDNHLKTVSFKASDHVLSSNNKWEKSFFNVEPTETGELLIGTKAGLMIYNIEKDSVEGILQFAPYQADKSSSNNHVRHTTQDPVQPNLFWSTTRAGFFLYDHTKKTFQDYSPPQYDAKQWIYHSFRYNVPIKSSLYTVVMQQYLMEFNTLSRQWQQLAHWQDSTNSHQAICDIKPLNDQYLFVSGKGTGPYLVDPANKKYYPLRFTINRKSPKWKEYWSFCVDQNGYLWTSYWPNYLLKSKKPIIKSTPSYQLDIHKIIIDTTELDYRRIQNNQLQLQQQERNISIKYKFINTDPAKKWVSRYRLKGHTSSWDIPIHDIAYIKGLSAGNYNFEAELIGNDGSTFYYNDLQISVAPYWYEKKIVIVGGVIIMLLALLLAYWIFRVFERTKNSKLSIEEQLDELEKKALKSEMAPHFIFNSLNTIKKLVEQEGEKKAVHYLNQFSGFTRKVLHFSEEPSITLEEELELCKNYLEMEQLRQALPFKYQVEVAANTDPSFISIPPLLLQRLLEKTMESGFYAQAKNREIAIQLTSSKEEIKCHVDLKGIQTTTSSLFQYKNNDEIVMSDESGLQTAIKNWWPEEIPEYIHIDVSCSSEDENQTDVQVKLRIEI
ncbi:MAG: histidine kinase [Chitinophagales bacterium]|nr:histidine kinase [Chitinophagales bacterium]